MTPLNYGTVSGASYGITWSPELAETRPKTPSGLIVTQAVQTKDGWLGQVIVDKTIVWESAPAEDGEAAIHAANSHVVDWVTRGLQAPDDDPQA